MADELDIIKTAIMIKSPFLAALLRACRIVYTKQVDTLATNGTRTIFINNEYFDKLQPKNKMAVLLHEVLHLALQHHARAKQLAIRSEDYKKWNVATDSVINHMIKTDGFDLPEEYVTMELIENVLEKNNIQVPDEIEKMSSEEIYRLLQLVKDPPCGGCGLKHQDDDGDKKKPIEIDADIDPQDYWNKKITDATIEAKMVGRLPAYAERHFKLQKSKIKWHKQLNEALMNGIGNKVISTYTKINRRVSMLPGIQRLSVSKIWFVIDTSGSIDDNELDQACTEVYTVAKRFNIEIEVIFWDVDIEVQKFRSAKQVISKMKPKGGGGTEIRKALEYLRKHMKYNDAVVVMTDGYIFDIGEPEIQNLMQYIKSHASTSIFVTTAAEPPIPFKTIKI